jgi:hypothetical protein
LAALIELVGQALVRLAQILLLASSIQQDVTAVRAVIQPTGSTATLDQIYNLLQRVYTAIYAPAYGINSMLARQGDQIGVVVGNTQTNFGSPGSGTSFTLAELTQFAGELAYNLGQVQANFRSFTNPLLTIGARWYEDNPTGTAYVPPIDPSTILSSDATVLDWLNREYAVPGITWGTSGSNYVQGTDSYASNNVIYTCTLSQEDFDAIKAALYPVGQTAPVWPGLANVTLGTPLALSDGLTVPGPLDGVLIDITAVPPSTGFYPFGTLLSYSHIGGIVFVDDNGDLEEALGIGPQSQVQTPRSMSQADHAILRLKSGVTGTVTPWVRS